MVFLLNMNHTFCVVCLRTNGIRTALGNIHCKICHSFDVACVQQCSVRLFDLHTDKTFCGFKSNFKRIARIQIQCEQIGSGHTLNIQTIGI